MPAKLVNRAGVRETSPPGLRQTSCLTAVPIFDLPFASGKLCNENPMGNGKKFRELLMIIEVCRIII